MAQSVGQVALDIVLGKNTVSGVVKGAMADCTKVMSDSSATMSQKVQAIGSTCTTVGSALLPVSAAVTGVGVAAFSAANDFEDAMNQLTTIAGNASTDYNGKMQSMEDAVKSLSHNTGISASECAVATYSAISAGVDTAKSVQFVDTANRLAVGGFTDLSTATDTLTTVINAYGLQADDATAISDKLINTQNLGKTTVDELGAAMGKVIPTAAAYGVNVDNLCAGYVALTKNGIGTAEATTYMNGMLNELGNSGSAVAKIIQEQTGMSFAECMQSGMNLSDVMQILGDSVDGDTSALANLWGSSEAGKAALSIFNRGAEEFNGSIDAMANKTGVAQDAFEQMQGKNYELNKAMNDLNLVAIDLGSEIGTVLAPIIETICGGISKLTEWFSGLPEPIKQVIVVVGLVIAIAAPLLIIIGTIITTIGAIAPAIGGVVTFITGTAMPAIGGFFTFLAANPIVLIIGAIIAVGVLLITHWDTVKQVASDVWGAVTGFVGSCVDGVKNFVGGIPEFFSGIWENIKLGVSGLVTSVTEFFSGMSESLSGIWDGIGQIAGGAWEIIKNIVLAPVLFLCDLVTGDFEQLKSDISAVWNNIKDAASQIWGGIKTVVGGLVDGSVSGVKSAWNSAKDNVSGAWNTLKSNASSTWGNIKSTVTSTADNARSGAVNAFNNMKSSIGSTVSQIPSVIKNGFNSAISFITSLPSKALGWGRDFIMGIVGGIQSAIGSVIGAVSNVASTIRSYLHFSVPDVGALTDYESWMPDFMQGLASGINQNTGLVTGALDNLTGEMAVNPALSVNPPALKNATRAGTQEAAGSASNADVIELLRKVIEKLDGGGADGNDWTFPLYFGADLIDEYILSRQNRKTLRSGGRA